MEPLFIGPQHMQLYGVYHAPVAGASRSGASALLCPPAGQEYMRTHRAYRWLAERLSKRGYHVLRFDYPGLGDSSGAMTDQTLDSWAAAARLASDELAAIGGQAQHAVVATRLGTAVAASAFAGVPLRSMVLWEPRSRPYDYILEALEIVGSGGESRANFVNDAGDLHFNGFCYPRALLDSLQHRTLADCDFSKVERVLLVTGRSKAYQEELVDAVGRTSDSCEVCVDSNNMDWNKVDRIGGIFLPQDLLRYVDGWLK